MECVKTTYIIKKLRNNIVGGKNMKIAMFETSDIEKNLIKKHLQNHEITFFNETIQETPIDKFYDSDVLCVFVHSKVTKDIISKCTNLKLVCTRSTGIDHIDKDLLDEKGILLKNVPLYGENTVAEHTFALMLALSRRLRESYNNTLNGNYSTDGLMGFDLKDKTIGIIRWWKNRSTCGTNGKKLWYAC